MSQEGYYLEKNRGGTEENMATPGDVRSWTNQNMILACPPLLHMATVDHTKVLL